MFVDLVAITYVVLIVSTASLFLTGHWLITNSVNFLFSYKFPRLSINEDKFFVINIYHFRGEHSPLIFHFTIKHFVLSNPLSHCKINYLKSRFLST